MVNSSSFDNSSADELEFPDRGCDNPSITNNIVPPVVSNPTIQIASERDGSNSSTIGNVHRIETPSNDDDNDFQLNLREAISSAQLLASQSICLTSPIAPKLADFELLTRLLSLYNQHSCIRH